MMADQTMAQIGLQLYTLKEEAQKDFLGTLRRVAEMGYDGVEFAGYFDTPAGELRRVLVDLDLQVAGTHVGMSQLKNNLAQVIEYSQMIHCPAVICPAFADVDRQAEATYHLMADLFNRIGDQCRANGLRFLYHLHGYEFETYDGRYGLDILLDETEPANLGLELDTYWVEAAGLDAVESLQKYGPRCGAIHFKDMNTHQARRDTEIGEGVLDVPALLQAAQAFAIDWFVVEQEQFDRSPFESVAISLHNLRRLMETGE
jgi:sugar phosphate isomerase/epimerase